MSSAAETDLEAPTVVPAGGATESGACSGTCTRSQIFVQLYDKHNRLRSKYNDLLAVSLEYKARYKAVEARNDRLEKELRQLKERYGAGTDTAAVTLVNGTMNEPGLEDKGMIKLCSRCYRQPAFSYKGMLTHPDIPVQSLSMAVNIGADALGSRPSPFNLVATPASLATSHSIPSPALPVVPQADTPAPIADHASPVQPLSALIPASPIPNPPALAAVPPSLAGDHTLPVQAHVASVSACTEPIMAAASTSPALDPQHVLQGLPLAATSITNNYTTVINHHHGFFGSGNTYTSELAHFPAPHSIVWPRLSHHASLVA